jgi:hypothetical protein
LGVIGDDKSLNIFVSKLPTEAWGANPGDQGATVSDLRRICYWMSTEGKGGLCRFECNVVTSSDALSTDPPSGDIGKYLLAPEVQSVEFSYFDGTNWNDSWDSTLLGQDGITPQGSPRAIAIKIGMVPINGKKGELKTYRHVIAITTANGMAPLPQNNTQNSSTTGNTNTSGNQ